MRVPPGRENDYTLNESLADHAIEWLHEEHSVTPAKPFFLYYAPGATHQPLHVPKRWIAPFKGKFDSGWDRYRDETIARQKMLGVIPQNAVLTPRPRELPAWESLPADEKRLAARMMEVYAGYMAQTDHEIGRVLDAIAEQGQLDMSIEMNGGESRVEDMLPQMDAIGGPSTSPLYPAAWAWAANTPFQWGKRVATYLGGTRDPLVVTWPAKIHDAGGVRDQFSHVVDVVPTVLEAVGLPEPTIVDGVKQQPMNGASFAASFTDPKAPSLHTVQYFEILGNRAIYSHEWMAGAQWRIALEWRLRGHSAGAVAAV
jgi:arylsulfatase